MRVLLSAYATRGDVAQVVAPAVRLQVLGAEVRGCPPPDSSEGRQRGMRMYQATGSTDWEPSVVRSAFAAQRSTTATEVSQ